MSEQQINQKIKEIIFGTNLDYIAYNIKKWKSREVVCYTGMIKSKSRISLSAEFEIYAKNVIELKKELENYY